MFFPSRARLASWHPPMQRRRNLENSAVPTLLARGSRLAFRATMCRAEGDLEACWNRILTIFDPYTFSHSQGQGRAYRAPARHVFYGDFFVKAPPRGAYPFSSSVSLFDLGARFLAPTHTDTWSRCARRSGQGWARQRPPKARP